MTKIFTNFIDAIIYCASKRNNSDYDIIPTKDENNKIMFIVKERIK